MARHREILAPCEATTEGARRLRELLLTENVVTIARRVLCDEGAIRHYARERRRPSPPIRRLMFEKYGVPIDAWFRAAVDREAYDGNEPPTVKRS